jgi:transposase
VNIIGTIATDAELSRRRNTAIEMAREGFTQVAIGQRLKVTQPTVARWLRGTQRPGNSTKQVSDPDKTVAGVGHSPKIGRAPLLTDEQLQLVYARRPDHEWTGSQFTDAISNAFGVTYSSARYGCLLLKSLRDRSSGSTRFDTNRRQGKRPTRRKYEGR